MPKGIHPRLASRFQSKQRLPRQLDGANRHLLSSDGIGSRLTLTIIDYSTAFDSVSHTYIDQALKEAGTSNKQGQSHVHKRTFTRRLASLYATSPTADGAQVKSKKFGIRRGIL